MPVRTLPVLLISLVFAALAVAHTAQNAFQFRPDAAWDAIASLTTSARNAVSHHRADLGAKKPADVSRLHLENSSGLHAVAPEGLARYSPGGSSALNAAWTPSTTNFIVEGDSIAADWADFASIPALSGKAAFHNVAVSGSYVGATNGSGPGYNVFARYMSDVYPKRPAAHGGVAGIAEAVLLLMLGTNNNYDLALARYATYIATAKSHGFTVIVCTIYATEGFHASGGPTPYTAEACTWFSEFNRGLYDGTAGAHFVVPIDRLFSDTADPGISRDKLHLSRKGNARCISLINAVLLSDGTEYAPSPSLQAIARIQGAAPGSAPMAPR